MAAVTEVCVPDIGDFGEVPVIEILVAVGDTVALEDPLVTLESDKATMDIPAPVAGVVRKILVTVGDKVSQGTPIAAVEAAEGEAAPPPAAGAPDAEPEADDETEIGSDSDPDPEPDTEPEPEPEPEPDDGADIYASPSVRKLARELSVALGGIAGTGRKGRVTTDDVRAAAAAPATGPALAGLAPWPTVDFAKYGDIERVPLTRIQRISGPNLARNWALIPHVTHQDEADITELEAFRKRINAEQDAKVTMVALLLVACAATLKEFPQFNAALDGDDLVLRRYYHIGFAADTPQGLVVPVIKDADRKGLLELAGELRALSAKARDGKLMPAEMAGGTFTISSLGGIGGTGFTPIVNAPEVAILGVTRSALRPVWDGGAFVPRLMLPLSLSYDHRVIDGAAAARFCVHLCGVLADLRRVLL